MSALPLGDWQFWVATILALAAVGVVIRPLLPRRSSTKKTACPGCPSGETAEKPSRPKHVDLTIGGRRVRS
jgi:hypothetical protein